MSSIAKRRIPAILALCALLLYQSSFAWHQHDGKLLDQTDCLVCFQLNAAGDAATSLHQPLILPQGLWAALPYIVHHHSTALLTPSARGPPAPTR